MCIDVYNQFENVFQVEDFTTSNGNCSVDLDKNSGAALGITASLCFYVNLGHKT